jgi:hypothetical protein
MTQKPTLPEEGLIGTTYWHVATFPPLLLNNAPLYRGLVPTVSLAARHEAGVVTPNDVDPMVGPFEEFLERMRKAEFPNKPGRRGALYLFDSEETAAASARTWFGGQKTWI